MADKRGEIMLSLPADKDFVLLARMAVSGLGMLAGLDVDLIDDLRTATDECCDCLLHQPVRADRLELRARVESGRLYCCLNAVRSGGASDLPQSDLEITRGVLETLMPDVSLQCDACGVGSIGFSLPV
ncbi:MAG TPA: hypothetical protein PLP25_11560 [Candidatus Limiplasma sp.]|nr:hypothetical protein [Candidatus Limiplasma sp.]HPS82483.1 hypothetical protein [Candidatus Limiplasma sp.]